MYCIRDDSDESDSDSYGTTSGSGVDTVHITRKNCSVIVSDKSSNGQSGDKNKKSKSSVANSDKLTPPMKAAKKGETKTVTFSSSLVVPLLELILNISATILVKDYPAFLKKFSNYQIWKKSSNLRWIRFSKAGATCLLNPWHIRLYTMDEAAKMLYSFRRNKEVIFDIITLQNNAECIRYIRSLVEGIFTRTKFENTISSGNFVLVLANDAGSFSHIHLVHECIYIESRCRCFVSRLDHGTRSHARRQVV